MPRLIKNIEGTILDNFNSDTQLVISVEGFYGPNGGTCGRFDYINTGGFEAFIQDFSRVQTLEYFATPPNFGLKNNTNFVTLEISY